MMRKHRLLVTAATAAAVFVTAQLLAPSAHAARVLSTVNVALETDLAQLTLPESESGRLGVKLCTDCTLEFLPVTPATAYRINGTDFPLAQFRAAVAEIRSGQGRHELVFAGVIHEAQSRQVVSVEVSH